MDRAHKNISIAYYVLGPFYASGGRCFFFTINLHWSSCSDSRLLINSILNQIILLKWCNLNKTPFTIFFSHSISRINASISREKLLLRVWRNLEKEKHYEEKVGLGLSNMNFRIDFRWEHFIYIYIYIIKEITNFFCYRKAGVRTPSHCITIIYERTEAKAPKAGTAQMLAPAAGVRFDYYHVYRNYVQLYGRTDLR